MQPLVSGAVLLSQNFRNPYSKATTVFRNADSSLELSINLIGVLGNNPHQNSSESRGRCNSMRRLASSSLNPRFSIKRFRRTSSDAVTTQIASSFSTSSGIFSNKAASTKAGFARSRYLVNTGYTSDSSFALAEGSLKTSSAIRLRQIPFSVSMFSPNSLAIAVRNSALSRYR